MNALLTRIKAYFHNAWGRTAAGFSAALAAGGTAIMSVQDDVTAWLPHIVTLTSAKIGAGIVLFVLSVASYLRHQKAAGTIADLKAQLAALQAKVGQ
jgi:hypothetical protein